MVKGSKVEGMTKLWEVVFFPLPLPLASPQFHVALVHEFRQSSCSKLIINFERWKILLSLRSIKPLKNVGQYNIYFMEKRTFFFLDQSRKSWEGNIPIGWYSLFRQPIRLQDLIHLAHSWSQSYMTCMINQGFTMLDYQLFRQVCFSFPDWVTGNPDKLVFTL